MVRRIPATVFVLDKRNDASAVAAALRQAGMDVVEFTDSRTALDAATAIHPRVIVASFDSGTRDDRLAFCRAIRANPGTSGIPIVPTAADVTEDDTALATDPGVLVLAVKEEPDATKLAAAVAGVLVAQRAESLHAGEGESLNGRIGDDMPNNVGRPNANHEDVERRAYELFERRGRADGGDWDDWFQAEREIRGAKASAVTSSPRSRRRADQTLKRAS